MRIKTKILFIIALTFTTSYAQKFYSEKKLSLNSKQYNEFAPVLLNDKFFFCSDRKNDIFITTTDTEGNSLSDIYYVQRKDEWKFGNFQVISNELNTRYYEGPVAFNKDGTRIFITRTIDVSQKITNQDKRDSTFGIFISDMVNGKWTKPVAFPFNSLDYNIGFPFLSSDDKYLYFCSQNPEGFGGFDIYVSEYAYNRWKTPVNVGNKINTPENEVFPFLHKSGRLYFASRGHEGMGGLDIFFSEKDNGEWKEPVLLPTPFNSRHDDFALIINSTLDTGYLSSTRSRSSMDIYMITAEIPVFSTCKDQEENDYCYFFKETGTTSLDTTSFRYQWDLGDGTIIEATEAEHCYEAPGKYIIALNVIDTLTNDIFYNEATYELIVEKVEQPYISVADTGYINEKITFSGKESYIKKFEIDEYYWDFGDEERAVGIDVNHTYSKSGEYIVQLGVTSKTNNASEFIQKMCSLKKIIILKKRD